SGRSSVLQNRIGDDPGLVQVAHFETPHRVSARALEAATGWRLDLAEETSVRRVHIVESAWHAVEAIGSAERIWTFSLDPETSVRVEEEPPDRIGGSDGASRGEIAGQISPFGRCSLAALGGGYSFRFHVPAEEPTFPIRRDQMD